MLTCDQETYLLERDRETSSIVGAAHFFRYSFKRTFAAKMRDVKAVLFEGPLDAHSMRKVAEYGLQGDDTPSVVDAITPEAAKEINRRLAHLIVNPASAGSGLGLVRQVKQTQTLR